MGAATRALCACLVLFAASSTARGDVDTESTVEYLAPAACPSRQAFVSELLSRSGGALPATRPIVTVKQDSGHYAGRLEMGATVRTLVSADCKELVASLALIASLYVAPVAPAEPERAPIEDRPETPLITPSEIPTAAKAATSAVQRRRWVLSGGASAAIVYGISPSFAPGLQVFADLRRSGPTAWQPSLRVGYAWARSRSEVAGGGTAVFSWQLGSLELCPARIALWRFSITPCVGIDIGALEATTAGVGGARTDQRLWLAPSIAGRLAFDVVRHFDVFMEGSLSFPVFRARYYLEPDTSIFEVPALTARGTLGVELWY